jgi:hypothetical protein
MKLTIFQIHFSPHRKVNTNINGMLDLKEVPKITQSNLQQGDNQLGLPMN